MNEAKPIRRRPLIAALLAAMLVTACVFAMVRVRSDLADLLPAAQSEAGQVMMEQMRAGPASTLILIGVQGAPEQKLAAISRAMTGTLQATGLFRLVQNGSDLIGDDAVAVLFRYRYLLAPEPSPAAFQTAALRQDFQGLLAALQSSAAPVVEQFGLPDPTGAFRAMMQALAAGSTVRSVDGVWFAPHRARALLLAQTASGGLDFAAENQALQAVRAAFAAARHDAGAAQARLLLSGPAVFAYDAAHSIRRDVRLLAIASSLAVAALLFWRFRSLYVAAVIAVPLLLATAAGALAVQLCFGFVQGITLGFGMTMLGVTVDYPVLLIGHRKRGEAAPATLKRIGHAFNLAVLAAALGLTGMAFAGFPGLAQFGVFAVAGILVAGGVTRFLLPPLIVAAELAPVSAGDTTRLMRIEAWRRWRLPALIAVAAAGLAMAAVGGPRWDRDLADLSPVPAAALALDGELRADLGAPDTGQALLVSGPSVEQVLRQEEVLLPRLRQLTQAGAIGGADCAALLVPSVLAQRLRAATLPDDSTLAARVTDASQGLGFSPTAFTAFLDGVAASKKLVPLTPATLPPALAHDPLVAARLGALLFRRGETWFGMIALSTVKDPARLAAAAGAWPGVTLVDMHAETNAIAAGYTRQAVPWLLAGAAAAVLALAAGLRDMTRLLLVLGSVGAALLVTLAGLTFAGARLSLVHVVALQFVAGIGLDYALFFSRPRLDIEERARTLRTLFTCNAMALLTFGLLCLCRTPILRDIGVTVAGGVIAAMLCGFLFAGALPRAMPLA